MKRRIALLLAAITMSAAARAATYTWSGDCNQGTDAALIGAAGDLFQVGGSFNNASTNTGFNILGSTFEFTGSGAHNLEQASRNLGPLWSALTNNWALGTLQIDGGTVTVVDNFPNNPGPNAVYVSTLTGSGTLNVGTGMIFYYGSLSNWTGAVNLNGNGIFRPLLLDAADTDGDGVPNWKEVLCGTEPTNSVSVLRITRIAKENNDIRVSWRVVGSHSYILQTNAPTATGSFTNNFADMSPLISVPGTGESVTNYLDSGGATNKPSRFYRIRLGP